jgi:uncharacterized membrane protein
MLGYAGRTMTRVCRLLLLWFCVLAAGLGFLAAALAQAPADSNNPTPTPRIISLEPDNAGAGANSSTPLTAKEGTGEIQPTPAPNTGQSALPISDPDPLDRPVYLEGTVLSIKIPATKPNQPPPSRILSVKLTTGETLSVRDDIGEFKVGQEIEVFQTLDPEGLPVYYATDHLRRWPLLWLLVLFVAAAGIVARWKGLRAVLAMFISLAVIGALIVPLISGGSAPLPVTLLGAGLIVIVSTYFVHGFNWSTSAALAGTLTAIVVALGLGVVFSDLAFLNGYGSDEALYIQAQNEKVNLRGLMLAGILIGSLGALVDTTITQAAVVRSLARVNPRLGIGQLYQNAMSVGHEHIGSLINTLVLAYAGSALPLFVLFQLSQADPLRIINSQMIAQEVVHTLVGSIALIIAVPLSTLIAARLFVGNQRQLGRNELRPSLAQLAAEPDPEQVRLSASLAPNPRERSGLDGKALLGAIEQPAMTSESSEDTTPNQENVAKSRRKKRKD